MTDLIGKTLGKYQIVTRVGVGGMARVYKAYQASLDRYVALKVLHSHLAEEADFVKRFEREATAVARLRHPNIVQVFDYDVDEGLYFIVMEFVEGPTLKAELNERVKRQEQLGGELFSLEEIVGLFSALADAIEYAHERGMVHRDLKPGNIMFTAEGQVLLTDFGLARIAYASRHSRTGALSGTPAYMAPEQVQGKRVDERSDIYSIGVMLYELLTGRVPFTADSTYALMTMHVTDTVPSPREYNPELSPEVETMVLKVLSKEPDMRYQNAAEFAEGLQQASGIRFAQQPAARFLSPIATQADSLELSGITATPGRTTPSYVSLTSPYRGLYAFREEDAPYFFGREVFTERLLGTLDDQAMAAIIGPSGSGKSSVVFAGLLPRLRQRDKRKIIEMRPGSQPFHSLANALVTHLSPELGETARLLEIKELASALQTGRLEVADVLMRLHQTNNGRQLLVVDQFEELYTLCTDETIRHRFPNALFEAVAASRQRKDLDFTLILTLRADFMGQALADRPFSDALQEADVKLGPMTRAELSRAIESPAAKKGAVFEAGLVDRILDDVGDEPGNLPLLEFALTLLWERRTGRRLTHAAYETIGRVEGSLARYADQIYEGLRGEEQDRARRVFTQMVRPGEGTEDTRRLATRTELGDADWSLAQRLADARLVVTGRSPEGVETVEVVHEALIRGWARLQEWMNNERSFRAWQERLRVSLRQWQESGRDEGALLRGVPLGEAEEWLAVKKRDLSLTEIGYIQSSIAMREQRAAEREAQRQRELEAARQLADEQQRRAEAEYRRAEDQVRSTKRLRILALVLAAVFVLAVAAAIWAIGESQDAAQQADARATEVVVRTTAESNARDSAELAATRAQESANARVTAEAERFRANAAAGQALNAKDEAESERDRADNQAILALSRQLAAQSTTLLGPQLDLALLLSLEANNLSDSAETASSVLAGLQASPNLLTYLRGHPGIVQSVAFDPDVTMLATAGSDGSVLLWELDSHRLLDRFEGHDERQLVNRVAISPDGKLLATGSDDQSIIIWDIESRQPLRRLTGHTAWVQAVDFSPDSQTLVSGGGDRTVVLWDVSTGEQLAVLSGHGGPLWDVVFSPNGRLIASSSADGTAIIWDVETREPLRTLSGHTAVVFKAAFDPTSERVVTASGDSSLILWDIASGEQVGEAFSGHVAGVVFADFAPDGRAIVSAGADSTIRFWDAESHQQTQLWANHNAFVSTLAYSPDGRLLASGDGSGTVILWDVALPGQSYAYHQLSGHTGAVNKVAYDPLTGLLASVGADSTVRRWDIEGQLEAAAPITHALRISAPVASLAFNADGSLLATGSENGTVIVWDITSGQPITNGISAHANGVTSLALSPDGQTLVASGPAGFISVWNSDTGAPVGAFAAGHQSIVNVVAISPDSQFIASGGADGAITIRAISELQAGQVAGRPLTTTQSANTGISSLAFSADSNILASGDGFGGIVLWDVQNGQALRRDLSAHAAPIQAISFYPDNTILASGDANGVIKIWDVQNLETAVEIFETEQVGVAGLTFADSGESLVAIAADGSTVVWDLASGERLSPIDEGRYGAGPVAISPDGRFTAGLTSTGSITVNNRTSGEPTGFSVVHETPFLANLSSVAYSPDGQILASAGFDSAIVFWNPDTGQPLKPPLLGHTSIIVSMAFSPDGLTLVSGSCNRFHPAGSCIAGEIILWDVASGERLDTLTDTVGFPQGLAFSPDGKILAASDCNRVEVAGVCLEGAIQLWDVESRQPTETLSGHSGLIWSITFSSDGKLMASSSADNTIIIWEVASGEQLGRELTNHGGPVRRVAFSPDGKRLASAGLDNLVFLWDVETGQAVGGPLAVHSNNAMDVAFSSDGKTLVSSDLDGIIIVSDVDLESWRARACQIANRNMRLEEWEQFFGRNPYHVTCIRSMG